MSDIWGQNKTLNAVKLELEIAVCHVLGARNRIGALRNGRKFFFKEIDSKNLIHHERNAGPIRYIDGITMIPVVDSCFCYQLYTHP